MIRIFRHYIPKSLLLLGTSEAAILIGSMYLGVTFQFIEFNPTNKLLVGETWIKALLYCFVMMMAMAGMGLYQRSLRDDIRGILFRSGLALLAGLMFMVIVFSLFPPISIGTSAFTFVFALSACGVIAFRGLVYRFGSTQMFSRRVLILGVGQMATMALELRRRVDRQDMNLIGFLPIDEEESLVPTDRTVAGTGSLLDTARHYDIDEIVVGADPASPGFPVSEVLDCKMSGIRVKDMVTFFEQQTGKIKLDALDPRLLVFSEGFIQAVLKGYVHRLFDVFVSATVLCLVWPLMLATVVLIWLESGCKGAVLYKQTRVGRHSRNFEVLKFRSMREDAEQHGAQWATTNDTRVTRVGAIIRKLRIDELPQLLNVLRGDMSFVGPRPERPEFVAQLREKIPYYDLRHRVNPGITGWAQICYPYGSSDKDAKEKLQFDLYYIKNYSLFLDLMILIQTAQVILWGKGAR